MFFLRKKGLQLPTLVFLCSFYPLAIANLCNLSQKNASQGFRFKRLEVEDDAFTEAFAKKNKRNAEFKKVLIVQSFEQQDTEQRRSLPSKATDYNGLLLR